MLSKCSSPGQHAGAPPGGPSPWGGGYSSSFKAFNCSPLRPRQRKQEMAGGLWLLVHWWCSEVTVWQGHAHPQATVLCHNIGHRDVAPQLVGP